MRQYKTSKKNRATYTYYSADGKKLMELIPGENGVTEADIAMLHEQDDLEYNAQRREDYHAPVHYDSYTVSDGQDGTDRNPYLTDTDSSPEDLILGALDASERKAAIRMLWDALLPTDPVRAQNVRSTAASETSPSPCEAQITSRCQSVL